ncbi:KxYKxGKxW signal peptide domain-containing protein [Lactiplantibacillus pentosus]|uniref:KxYKxGKxW signal peptide domain-containing protein n=1 Tax=Lactiplantibacillus pentosus TaxID=1589 RepID=UPI001C1E4233|nr:alpha/beta hydrolase [Lactiplantibacillus pentosus]MCC3161243.1 alpha/beta hydrolase [Lactiplantibacillus pentosus]MCJ8187152.1 alpha/beta hydrolase [Lactiplantibacillus pentosus]
MKRNSQPSATIDHYKMFKDGKHWVYAGITIAGLGSTLMLTTNALADTTTPVSATTTASAPNATTSDQLSQAAGATAADSSSVTDTNSTPVTASSETSTSNTTGDDTTATTAATTSRTSLATTTTDAVADAANNTSATDNAVTSGSTNNTVTDQTSTDATATADSTKSTTTTDAVSDKTSAGLDSTEMSSADTTTTVANQADTTTVSTDTAANTTSSTTDDATTDDASTGTTTAATTLTGEDVTTDTTTTGEDATTDIEATADTTAATTAVTPASTSLTTTDSGHGLIYETNDQTGNQKSTITIEQTGPYSVTWKKVTTSNKDETTTVTLDASDIVAIVNEIKDLTNQAATSAVQEKLAAAKAKLNTIVDQLKELPTTIASTIVGNLIYPIVFTGSGSEALSNLRTEMNEHRYDISNTWEGLDPVAYATDRAAAEEYYPAAVTWWNNVTKETWTLPEYNDPTQNVRAYYIQNGDATKTVIIGQGWTEHLDWIGYVSKIWYDMGYNILMPSQRGQFLSDGDDLTFGYQDKYDWLNWVKMVDERNGANSEVVFYGQSLGADTVLEAASVPGLSKSVKAVVADAGYATLPELGASLYTKAINYVSNALQSVGLPAITSLPFLSYDKIVPAINARLIKTQGFSVDDLSAVDAASKVTIPLLLIHTEDDAFIPYTQSLELAAANHSADQEVWILPGQVGGHAAANNAILQYQQHLQDFLTPLVSVAEAEDESVDVDPSADSTETSDAIDHTTDATVDTDGKTSTTDTTDETDGLTDTTETTNSADSSTDTTHTAKNSASATGSAESADGTTNGNDSSQTDPDATTTDDNQDDDLANADGSTSATVKNGRLAPVTTTDESATGTVSLADATPSDVDMTNDQTDADEASATDAAVTNNDWLVNHDHSGSVVTASLREDLSAADAKIAMTPTAVSTTKPEADSDLAPVSSPTTKSAPALPQTDETSQSWLTALGASLLTVVTGLWTRIRRRFA